MKIISIALLLLLLLISAVHAQNSDESVEKNLKFLIINPVSGALNDVSRKNAKKVILQASTKQSDFTIFLSKKQDFNELKKTLYSLNVKAFKNGNQYSVEAFLKNEKSGKIALKVRKKNITYERLILNIETAVNLLFKSYSKKKENNEKAKKEKIIQKGVRKSAINNPQKNLNSEAIDFRQRIRSLKNDVDKKVKKISKARIKEEKDKKKAEKENPKNEGVLNASALAALNDKNKQMEKLPSVAKDSFITLATSYRKMTTASLDTATNVDLSYDSNFIIVAFNGGRQVAANSDWYYLYGLSYGFVFTPVEQRLPEHQTINGGIRRNLGGFNHSLSFSLSSEIFTFINLPQATRGFVAGSSQILWSNLIYRHNGVSGGIGWSVMGNIGLPYLLSSDYQNLVGGSLSGNRTRAGVILNGLLDNLEFMLEYERLSVVGSGSSEVELSSNAITFETTYLF